MQLDDILSRPSLDAFFGRDDYGRSILVRLIEGFKNSTEIIIVVSIISCTFGVLIGTISGYLGGRFDQAVHSSLIYLCLSQEFYWQLPLLLCSALENIISFWLFLLGVGLVMQDYQEAKPY